MAKKRHSSHVFQNAVVGREIPWRGLFFIDYWKNLFYEWRNYFLGRKEKTGICGGQANQQVKVRAVKTSVFKTSVSIIRYFSSVFKGYFTVLLHMTADVHIWCLQLWNTWMFSFRCSHLRIFSSFELFFPNKPVPILVVSILNISVVYSTCLQV